MPALDDAVHTRAHDLIMPFTPAPFGPLPAVVPACPSAACCASLKLSARDICSASITASKPTGRADVEAEMYRA